MKHSPSFYRRTGAASLVVAVIIVGLLARCGKNASQAEAAYTLPSTSETPAVAYTYFPTRTYAFVFRNWTVVPVGTLAKVLGTDVENVEQLAEDMGLPRQGNIDPRWQSMKGYITVLRRNWHLLPYGQLTTLLGMTDSQLAWRLIADDFLIQKLGQKPKCDSIAYSAPTRQQRQQARRMAAWLKELNDTVTEKPRFEFYKELPPVPTRDASPMEKSTTQATNGSSSALKNAGIRGLRMAYSYSSEYGDPLLDKQLSSFPEELLAQLSAKGVNALWIHTVLSSLVPAEKLFPGDKDCDKRLKNLQRLVDLGGKYGIKFYLYSNEPRGAAATFFDRPEMKGLGGVQEGEQRAFCTSDPRVLDWLTRSYKRVFSRVKGLGGLFTITASENLTHCASHWQWQDKHCPRCEKLGYDKVLADVNNAITRGVKEGDPQANVIVWDWGWVDEYSERIINRLDKRVSLMSVSEWSQPFTRGGVSGEVNEYSISVVGPGPRARSHWDMARRAGLGTMAKIQVNTTWELGSFTAVPAMRQIAQHARNLSREHVDGIMLCWSLGGYPTVNMSVFSEAFAHPELTLDDLALKHYGAEAGPLVKQAWDAFSDGYDAYPYNQQTLYLSPQLVAPANPFFLHPTGYKATMVGFPYDDLESWRTIYPVETYIGLMRQVADGFQKGCLLMQDAEQAAKGDIALRLHTERTRAQAEALHFRSVVNQAEFTHRRNLMLGTSDTKQREQCRQEMMRCVENELQVVREMIPLVRQDPTIGYEASNQYVYIEQDLREKYVNLRTLQEQLHHEQE